MPDLIHYAIPAFVVLLLLEVVITSWDQKDHYEVKDTLSSLGMGLGNVAIGLFTKGWIFLCFTAVYQYRWFDLEYSWWTWILLFFAEDFTYYWFHRISHQSRFFWASHVVHHSSQKYNLGTALRQTWTGSFTSFIFWLWLPLVGFPPAMIMTMMAISLIYQFWIHTETIGKLGPLEWIFNTPSHHRVHHASDAHYLDRNHAGILIIWDRLFGTFVEETQRPRYGLTQNLQSFNPLVIAFHEWRDLGKDLRSAKTLGEAWGYLFKAPGWSPDGRRKTSEQLRREWLEKTKKS
jgi:sterol desaturase/sphingolipid hydroxylase (fatty acid hydroxylase superfamily)